MAPNARDTLITQLHAEHGLYPLPNMALVEIAGLDAQEFLQGQLTLDLSKLSEGAHRYTAWCSAKGRVWTTLRIWRHGAGFRALLPAALCENFLRRMRMFVLRSTVTLEKVEDVIWGEIHAPGAAELDNSLPLDVHHRLCIGPALPEGCRENSDNFLALRVLSGEAQIDTDTQEKFLPQALRIDELDGLHFNKGCYVGQEIVARVHYRGKSPQIMQQHINPGAADEEKFAAVLWEAEVLGQRLVQSVESNKG